MDQDKKDIRPSSPEAREGRAVLSAPLRRAVVLASLGGLAGLALVVSAVTMA
jgi:hypothetical protein